MEDIRKYINIPVGKIISRRLAALGMTQADLAGRTGYAPQALNAIIKCRRSLPLDLSLRIERELSLEEGLLARIQLQNVIEETKRRALPHMDPPHVRRIIFWDTDFDRIDWARCRDYVIERVRQYGSSEEITEIMQYYGTQR